jgi:hypothetical protein
MQLSQLDPNTLIIGTVVLATVYAVVVGKVGVRHLVLATCAGAILVAQFGGQIGDSTTVRLAIFAAPVLLFAVMLGKLRDKGNGFLNVLGGVAAGAFIAASALTILPAGQQSSALGASFIATELHLFYPIVLAVALALAVVTSLAKHKPKSHH